MRAEGLFIGTGNMVVHARTAVAGMPMLGEYCGSMHSSQQQRPGNLARNEDVIRPWSMRISVIYAIHVCIAAS